MFFREQNMGVFTKKLLRCNLKLHGAGIDIDFNRHNISILEKRMQLMGSGPPCVKTKLIIIYWDILCHLAQVLYQFSF